MSKDHYISAATLHVKDAITSLAFASDMLRQFESEQAEAIKEALAHSCQELRNIPAAIANLEHS